MTVALPRDATFAEAVAARAPHAPLNADGVAVLQLNLGKLCNMTCRHCHVDAGPHRTDAQMSRATMEQCLALLDRTGARTLDLTGGAPELNPHFRWLVDEAARRGVHVMDRCNLTVLLLPRFEDLPSFFAERRVEVVCSLPHWRRPNTDAQRGEGTHERSLEALRRLNAAGYGKGDPERLLTVVHNPAGAFLPSGQAAMEREWKAGLARTAGVSFDRLIALNNMPIQRFRGWLEERGLLTTYTDLLRDAFNPAAVAGLMCRDTLSVGWDGTLYDCDFNQQLEWPTALPDPRVDALDVAQLRGRAIVTGSHCFGCTAGAGSSCGGATATETSAGG